MNGITPVGRLYLDYYRLLWTSVSCDGFDYCIKIDLRLVAVTRRTGTFFIIGNEFISMGDSIFDNCFYNILRMTVMNILFLL